MRKERKTFSQEFKKEAVGLVMEHGYSYAAAGRSLGIRGNLIGRWKRQLEDNASAAFPGKGKRTADQQRIYELETENRRLRMEKEILKNRPGATTTHRIETPAALHWCSAGTKAVSFLVIYIPSKNLV